MFITWWWICNLMLINEFCCSLLVKSWNFCFFSCCLMFGCCLQDIPTGWVNIAFCFVLCCDIVCLLPVAFFWLVVGEGDENVNKLTIKAKTYWCKSFYSISRKKVRSENGDLHLGLSHHLQFLLIIELKEGAFSRWDNDFHP